MLIAVLCLITVLLGWIVLLLWQAKEALLLTRHALEHYAREVHDWQLMLAEMAAGQSPEKEEC